MLVLWTWFAVLKDVFIPQLPFWALKTRKNFAVTEITKRSSTSGNIVAKLLLTTFPLKQLKMLDEAFKNCWKCNTEQAIKKALYTEAKCKVQAETQRM